MCIILLLDLTAAFDPVDHDILHSRLERAFGILEAVQDLFRPYFSGRNESVNIGIVIPKWISLIFGAPQGFLSSRVSIFHFVCATYRSIFVISKPILSYVC